MWKVDTQVRRAARAGTGTMERPQPSSLVTRTSATMTRKLHRIALAAAAVAALGASTITAAASADSAPAKHSKTMTVCVKSAYIDAPAPGKIFVGTIFKGEHFHVDRTVHVKKRQRQGRLAPRQAHRDQPEERQDVRRHRVGPGLGLLRLSPHATRTATTKGSLAGALRTSGRAAGG